MSNGWTRDLNELKKTGYLSTAGKEKHSTSNAESHRAVKKVRILRSDNAPDKSPQEIISLLVSGQKYNIKILDARALSR